MIPGHEPYYLKPFQVLRASDEYLAKYCGLRCLVDNNCESFSTGEGTCRLYDKDLRYSMWRVADKSGPLEFSSACCAESNYNLRPNPLPDDNLISPFSAESIESVIGPMRDPAVDPSHRSHFTPENVLMLFYSDGSPGNHIMLTKARLLAGTAGVLLENLGPIEKVTCSTDQLLIEFADREFVELARLWPPGTVIFTLSDGCNPDGERGVYILQGLNSSGIRAAQNGYNVVSFSVRRATLYEVVQDLQISYGQVLSGGDGNPTTTYSTTATSSFNVAEALSEIPEADSMESSDAPSMQASELMQDISTEEIIIRLTSSGDIATAATPSFDEGSTHSLSSHWPHEIEASITSIQTEQEDSVAAATSETITSESTSILSASSPAAQDITDAPNPIIATSLSFRITSTSTYIRVEENTGIVQPSIQEDNPSEILVLSADDTVRVPLSSSVTENSFQAWSGEISTGAPIINAEESTRSISSLSTEQTSTISSPEPITTAMTVSSSDAASTSANAAIEDVGGSSSLNENMLIVATTSFEDSSSLALQSQIASMTTSDTSAEDLSSPSSSENMAVASVELFSSEPESILPSITLLSTFEDEDFPALSTIPGLSISTTTTSLYSTEPPLPVPLIEVDSMSSDEAMLEVTVRSSSSTSSVLPPSILSSTSTSATSTTTRAAEEEYLTFPIVPDKELETGESESILEEATTLPSPPLATLTPAAPPGINMGGLGVLTPDPVTELWFGGNSDEMKDDESGAVAVRLTVDYKYPSIVLDHSSYIKNVACSDGSLNAKIDGSLAFNHSVDTWPGQMPLLFVTSATSCGNGEQNSFWLARSVTFDKKANTFRAAGKAVEIADVMKEMEIDFGKIEQRNQTYTEDELMCGKPPTDMIDNLPAIACGPFFDENLDAALGYYATEGGDTEQVLASAGVGPAQSQDLVPSRALVKRGWFWNAIKSVAKAVVKTVVNTAVTVVKTVANTVVDVAKTAASVTVSVVKAAVNVGVAYATNLAKLAVFVVTGDYSNSLTLPIDMSLPGEDTVWEGLKGFKIYEYEPDKDSKKWKDSKAKLDTSSSKLKKPPKKSGFEPGLELWCVECGVRGKFVATGSISATPLSGLKKAQIGVHGDMYIGAFLGLNAFTTYEKSIRKDLLVKGMPGWEIPKIVSLGPRVILAAQATFNVEAEGQLLTGVSLNWPSFQATLDFVDPSKSSQTGWTPVVTKKFEVNGEITAKASFGLPIILSFGINILDGVFERAVNLTDFPAITGTAKLQLEAGTKNNQIGTDTCQGITWDIALTNELRLDVPKSDGWKLHEWKSLALAKGCIGRALEPTSSSKLLSSTALPAVTILSSSFSSSSLVPAVPTVVPPPPPSFRCPGLNGKTYTDPGNNRETYAVTCNKDAPGADLISGWQASFEDCISWCGSTPDCVGIVWGPLRTYDRNCWLKNGWPTFVINPNPEFDPLHNAMVSLKCPLAQGKRFTDRAKNKNDYTVTCNKDAPGGDLVSAMRDSFESCLDWCGSLSNCVGVVYGPKRTYDRNCWLKNRIVPQVAIRNPIGDPLHNALVAAPGINTFSYWWDNPWADWRRLKISGVESSKNLENDDDISFIGVDIIDTTNTLKLNPSKNGNLFVSLTTDTTDLSNLTSGHFYADSISKTVMGDSVDRLLHYYPEVLETSGVSRLRLALWNKLPKGAKITTLAPVVVEGETLMLAIDATGDYLWPFVCSIKNQLNKVFLVKNPKTAGAVLERLNMKFTVTGGEAYSCEPLALKVKS